METDDRKKLGFHTVSGLLLGPLEWRDGWDGNEGDPGRPLKGKGQWGWDDLERITSFLVYILIFFQDVPSLQTVPPPHRPFPSGTTLC